jgi:hypothetical protein
MLTIKLEDTELFDEETSSFSVVEGQTLELEHSLVSLSKWEQKWQVPFLSHDLTTEQTLDYIWMMILTPNVPRSVVDLLGADHIRQVQEYIQSAATATTFATLPDRRGQGETITSELVYYWMVAFTIPFDCQDWHLNRLFALIRICNVKQNGKQKKMSRREMAERNAQINAARREQLKSTG